MWTDDFLLKKIHGCECFEAKSYFIPVFWWHSWEFVFHNLPLGLFLPFLSYSVFFHPYFFHFLFPFQPAHSGWCFLCLAVYCWLNFPLNSYALFFVLFWVSICDHVLRMRCRQLSYELWASYNNDLAIYLKLTVILFLNLNYWYLIVFSAHLFISANMYKGF